MRIGFDAKRAYYNRSGLGNYSRDIIRALHHHFPKDEYLLYTPSTRNSINFSDSEKLINITPRNTGLKLLQSYWRTYGIAKRLKNDGVDIYHGLSNELPNRINRSGVKSIVTIHDLIFLRHPEWYPPVDRWIYSKKFSYSSKVADGIIAISQQTKNDIIENYQIDAKKIEVIYQGCNNVFKQLISDTEKQKIKEKWNLPDEYILYVGTIEERKNLLSIVKALHQGNISIPLVAVGRKTTYFKQVKAYIDKHSLQHIYFLKEVPVTELPGIYQLADLFVYPSIFEGFGIPILEALYSRVPVITTTGGCFSEAGGNSSIYVDPGDIEAISLNIEKVLTDSKLKNEMIEKGYKHAQKFSDKTVAEKLMSFYKRILHGE